MNCRFSFINLFLVTLFLPVLVSCKSTPMVQDPDFLGDFQARGLEVLMVNTFAQGKNKLSTVEVQFVLYPKGNAVVMNFRYSMNNIKITLLQKDREALITAMNEYVIDYQAGKLLEANNKKKAFFGKTNAFLQWGLLAPSSYSKPDLRFEYQIADNGKPYFVIGNASSPETDVDGYLIRDGANSPAVRLAFSPIQCQNVIEMLDQKALVKIVDDMNTEAQMFDLPSDTGTEKDTGTVEAKELF